jgi:hypothetical protein
MLPVTGAAVLLRRSVARHFAAAVLAVLMASACVNGLLIWRVAVLRARLAYLTEDRILATNAKVLPIVGNDLDGKPYTVNYARSAGPTILYVFSPSCGWCRRNLRDVRELLRVSSGKYTAVGLSLTRDGLSEYVSASGLPMQFITDIPPSTVMGYRLGGTPQTIVISKSGRVLRNWRGAYGGEVRAEVESYFGVHLPDDVGTRQ